MTHGESYVAAYKEKWEMMSGESLTEVPPYVVRVGEMFDLIQSINMTYWQAQIHGWEAAEEDFRR
jgi:hypothetical protein